MIKVQYNIGTYVGLNGTAVIYSALTDANVKLLIHKVSVGAVGAETEHWVFMPKSAFSNNMVIQKATITSSENLSSYAETLPSGLADANGYITVDNEPNPVLPRLYSNQGFYSLKGANVVDYSGDAGEAKTGSTAKEASTVVVTSNAKTATEVLSDGMAWATKNWVIIIVALVLILELTGVTGFFIPKKKKTVRRRR